MTVTSTFVEREINSPQMCYIVKLANINAFIRKELVLSRDRVFHTEQQNNVHVRLQIDLDMSHVI